MKPTTELAEWVYSWRVHRALWFYPTWYLLIFYIRRCTKTCISHLYSEWLFTHYLPSSVTTENTLMSQWPSTQTFLGVRCKRTLWYPALSFNFMDSFENFFIVIIITILLMFRFASPLLRPIVVLVLGSLKAPWDWTCESRINYVDNTSRDFLASRS